MCSPLLLRSNFECLIVMENKLSEIIEILEEMYPNDTDNPSYLELRKEFERILEISYLSRFR